MVKELDDLCVSPVRFAIGDGEAVPVADEAGGRVFRNLRKRMIAGGVWIYPVVIAQPEVTDYGDNRDLVTREVLRDADLIRVLPGTKAIAQTGRLHSSVLEMAVPQIRQACCGTLLSAWYDEIEDAQVGELAVDEPEVNRAIQAGELPEVSLAYRVRRRVATDEEREKYGATRVQLQRFDPLNIAILENGRATTAIVADEGQKKPGGVRMKRTHAALLIEFGLDKFEQRDQLVPALDEIEKLRNANEQLVAADAANRAQVAADAAAAPAMPTGKDWIALAKIRETLGLSNDDLGDFEASVAEALASAGVEVPEGADTSTLKMMLSVLAVGMAKAAPAVMAEEGEAEPMIEEPAAVAADSRGRHNVAAGIGRKPAAVNNTTRKPSNMARATVGG